MKIETARILAEGFEIESEEPPSIMEIEEGNWRFNKPIHIKLKISLPGKTLYVAGRVWTTASIRCDRCLAWFEQRVGSEKFSFEKQIKYPGEIIDLTDSIREDIILSLPLKTLCRQACQGLCPRCGQNLNQKECGCEAIRSNSPFSALDKLEIDCGKESDYRKE